MNPVTLEDRFAAIDLQCRVAAAVDEREWEVFTDCFAADATAELPRTGGHARRGDMVAAIRAVVERLELTQHFLSNHRVELCDDGVRASCYVLSQHVRRRESQEVTYTFGGRYTDTMRRDPDGFRIRHRRLEVLWSTGDSGILH